jgi:nucleoside-triphosphatase THEP1/16S rRNA G527 N7-methylase RsmG
MRYFKESKKRHLLITGSRRSGKTEILNAILKYTNSFGGIITYPVRDSKFFPRCVILEDINDSSERGIIAVRNEVCTALLPNIDGFERIGKRILNRYADSNVELIVIDEIGFLENNAEDYQNTVLSCMDKKRTILVLRNESTTFINKIINRKDVYMVDLDCCNKKMFRWTKKSIKWYLEAEKNTKFYKNVIENMEKDLKYVKTALDIGCGLGGISIELAKKDISVTALDISPLAVETLRKRAEQCKLNNVKIINDDFEKTTIKEKYDMVIGSYVMGLINYENFNKFLNLTNKYLVFILPIECIKNDFSIQELYKKINNDLISLNQKTHLDVIMILNKKGLKYKIKFFETKFNQPIDSIEGGLEFIKYYFSDAIDFEKEIIEWLREKIKVEHNRFYIPSLRKSAIIILKK